MEWARGDAWPDYHVMHIRDVVVLPLLRVEVSSEEPIWQNFSLAGKWFRILFEQGLFLVHVEYIEHEFLPLELH